ncbi:hypothetical protein [Ereboglobus luteus]|uniref:Uncharacterized protein n=1 Tax=Ereboglobus luteus TaxID=1796921 RepID=A0A2U8DZU7_9BACT|nr:hypothetical protein [Ereboglobus luteus]AWI08127.1 hypothetical protein CKA38_01605 [Ereboglobus luteus]
MGFGAAGDSRTIYQINRHGKTRQGRSDPLFDFLNPEVERFVLGMLGEYAERYSDSLAFAGASLRVMSWQNTGFGNFGNIDWGYGDDTIACFERETGIKVPVNNDDPDRHERRFAWLTGGHRDAWMAWRCRKASDFFAKVRDALRHHAPGARLMLACSLPIHEMAEHGIDPGEIARLDGVDFVHLAGYGRRKTEAVDQRARDASLSPASLRMVAPAGAPARMLTTMSYFEASNKVAPPADLGYPANTRHGWISGAVNPAGAHYLERFALRVAECDALALGDGGNGYSLGQPALRTFLREYRSLPAMPFTPRPDACDPVAVWERRDGGRFLFYAVNRERFPVAITVRFAAPVTLTRLATGEPVFRNADEFTVQLAPYELRTFAAEGTACIQKIITTVPETALAHAREMTAWLSRLARDVGQGRAGNGLTDAQRARLREADEEARVALEQGRLWRARTLQEAQELREIYAECGHVPPLLDDNGVLSIPHDAVSGPALLERASGSVISLVESESLEPDWAGQRVVVSRSGVAEFELTVPADGRYRLQMGYVAGGGFSSSRLLVDGAPCGFLETESGAPRGRLAVTEHPVRLSKGAHRVSLAPDDGEKQGVLFLQATPVYEDIVANQWMLAGPFPAVQKNVTGAEASAAMARAMRSRAFAPEVERDFSAVLDDGAGAQLKWRRGQGARDFVDLQVLGGEPASSISYAVTHVIAPAACEVRIAYSVDYFARLWINGEIVEDYYHPAGLPLKRQKTRIVRLRPGANEIMLKVAAGSMGNGFWFSVNNPGDLRYGAMAGESGEYAVE